MPSDRQRIDVLENDTKRLRLIGAVGQGTFNDEIDSLNAAIALKLNLAGGTMTGMLALAAGNAGAPGASFASDTDSGFYSIAANTIGLSLGGALSWTFGAAAAIGPAVQAGAGSAAAPSFALGTNGGWYWDATNSAIAGAIAGAEKLFLSGSTLTTNTVGGSFSWNNTSEGASTFSNVAYSATSQAVYSVSRARGTIASAAVPQTGDVLGTFRFRGWTAAGPAFGVGAEINALVEETTWSATALGTYLRIRCCADGSSSLTEIARFNAAQGFSMFGANPVIDANRVHTSRSLTVAAANALSPFPGAGSFLEITDEGGGPAAAFSDGTALRRSSDGQVITSGTGSSRGLLSRFSGRASFKYQNIVHTVYQMLSDAGLLTKLLGLYVHAVPTNSSDALLNWITPGTRNAAIVGAPTWTANQGFTGDGSSALIDSVATLTTFGATQNNVAVGCYVRAAGTGSAKAVIGCDNVALARRMYLQTFTSGALAARCNDQTAGDTFTPGQYTGLFVLSRSASTGFNASVSDAAAAAITRTSVTQTSAVAFLGTADSTGSEFSNAQISFSFIATALSAADIANLRWILVDYYLVQVGAIAADYLVANLPLATTPPKGTRLNIADGAASPVFAAVPTGGGSLYLPVMTDGAAWHYG